MLKTLKFAALALLVGSSVSQAATELGFGLQPSVGTSEYQTAEFFANKVSELTDDEVKVALFPGAMLGDDRAMLQQMSVGELDITISSMGRLGLWIPEATVVDLPYVLKDHEHSVRVFNSGFGQSIRQKMEKEYNWKALSMMYNGTRQTTSNRPLNSMEDFKELKLRVPNAKSLLDYARLSGASPTPMSFSEVYLGLQTNAVDGQENPLHTIQSMKFHEVQENLAMTNHMVDSIMLIVSSSTWSKLTEEHQKAIQQASDLAADFQTQGVQDKESKLVAFFEKEGMNVTYPDNSALRKAMQPAYDEFDKSYGKKLTSEVLKI